MNNQDRKNVKAALDHINEARAIIARLSNSEHEKIDNMPESFQFSSKIDSFNEAISELDLAKMGLTICETHLKKLCPAGPTFRNIPFLETKFPKAKLNAYLNKALS